MAALIEEVRFARDSPLEGAGFEPSVPRGRDGEKARESLVSTSSTRLSLCHIGVPRLPDRLTALSANATVLKIPGQGSSHGRSSRRPI